MKYLLVLPLALALGGCVQGLQQADTQARAILANACPAADDAYAAYSEFKPVVNASTQAKVEQAKAAFESLCAGRQTATVASIVIRSKALYSAFDAARASAKANGGKVGYAGDLRKLDGLMARAKKHL
jgi:hypothetical protein